MNSTHFFASSSEPACALGQPRLTALRFEQHTHPEHIGRLPVALDVELAERAVNSDGLDIPEVDHRLQLRPPSAMSSLLAGKVADIGVEYDKVALLEPSAPIPLAQVAGQLGRALLRGREGATRGLPPPSEAVYC